MPERCYWTVENGERYFIPVCWGSIHSYADDPIKHGDCTCFRRPRFRKGEKARLERLYARLELIKRRIAKIEGMSWVD